MMTGVVNAALEASLRLSVEDTHGQVHEVEVILDTGFNGFLPLSSTVIGTLGLPWLYRQQGQLADGNLRVLDVFAASILWDGQRRTVEVEALDAQPLIGMALMRGYELRVHVQPGGVVTIAAVP
ncbi:MAG: clan AA aspartic protease [Pirellulales bacterium]|nr:clan AA aspartic protease [Pirellulales bacterium]